MYTNAASYLEEIRARRIALNNNYKKLKNLDYIIEPSAIQYKRDNVQTSPRQDGLEQKAIKHLEERQKIQDKIENDITFLYKRIDEAVDYISEMESEKQQEVLLLRYIDHMTWSEILEEKGVDDISSLHQLHRRALESLQKVIDNHSKTTPRDVNIIS